MFKEIIQKILSEAEVNHVVAFVENETQSNALHKFFLASLKDAKKTLINKLDSGFKGRVITNEEAGAELRAFSEAIHLVEVAFGDLQQFRQKPLQEQKKHPGR